MKAVAAAFALSFAANFANAAEFPVRQALTERNFWADPEFLATWEPRTSPTRIAHKNWPKPGPIFGRQPHAITARFDGSEIRSITLLFLDSGTHFGYVPREKAEQTEAEHRERFAHLLEETARDVEAGLILLATSANGDVGVLGQQALLRQRVTLFKTGELTSRFHRIDEQMVKITVFPEARLAQTWRNAERLECDAEAWQARIAARVNIAENGDRLLSEVPLFPQGDRAYCGVSALAMAVQYLGLAAETEDLAAAAGIRYGSTKGSKILETYQAATYELGMRLPRRTVFDFSKAKAAIDGGLPVIVWRRWRAERDYLHTQFARRFSRDATLTLPPADEADRELWPGESDYTHASVLTGYNDGRGEVIFTESWGERVRNRRMRVEEMEGTSYFSFYPAF